MIKKQGTSEFREAALFFDLYIAKICIFYYNKKDKIKMIRQKNRR